MCKNVFCESELKDEGKPLSAQDGSVCACTLASYRHMITFMKVKAKVAEK
jgi:hypothetical protein